MVELTASTPYLGDESPSGWAAASAAHTAHGGHGQLRSRWPRVGGGVTPPAASPRVEALQEQVLDPL